jgi:hypothetical protein
MVLEQLPAVFALDPFAVRILSRVREEFHFIELPSGLTWLVRNRFRGAPQAIPSPLGSV